MTPKVGDWVRYRKTWTRDQEERIAVIVEAEMRAGSMAYTTDDGFTLFEQDLLEIRPPQPRSEP